MCYFSNREDDTGPREAWGSRPWAAQRLRAGREGSWDGFLSVQGSRAAFYSGPDDTYTEKKVAEERSGHCPFSRSTQANTSQGGRDRQEETCWHHRLWSPSERSPCPAGAPRRRGQRACATRGGRLREPAGPAARMRRRTEPAGLSPPPPRPRSEETRTARLPLAPPLSPRGRDGGAEPCEGREAGRGRSGPGPRRGVGRRGWRRYDSRAAPRPQPAGTHLGSRCWPPPRCCAGPAGRTPIDPERTDAWLGERRAMDVRRSRGGRGRARSAPPAGAPGRLGAPGGGGNERAARGRGSRLCVPAVRGLVQRGPREAPQSGKTAGNKASKHFGFEKRPKSLCPGWRPRGRLPLAALKSRAGLG